VAVREPFPQVRVYGGDDLAERLPRLEAYVSQAGPAPLSLHPAWLHVLAAGLGHTPYCLEATRGGETRGVLALAHVRSFLFGRFLVSLPYLNYGGAIADDDATAVALIDRAVELADQLKVRYLELRRLRAVCHPKLADARSEKVQMRLALPATAGELWERLSCKVRNQVRKGQSNGLTVAWGTQELLREFHNVFSHNMRDLGTPCYGRKLFAKMLETFPGRAEICVVRAGTRCVAAGLLMHGWSITEIPSASSLRNYNHTCANMLMYWHLLKRTVERGQGIFDFGRSSKDAPTFRFKKQWGATPTPAEWQYYGRSGSPSDLRPANPRYGRLIGLWKRLPVTLARLLGPCIVRGIP
jgi:FemAB-related protein (PEP-CTERM system-associated)